MWDQMKKEKEILIPEERYREGTIFRIVNIKTWKDLTPTTASASANAQELEISQNPDINSVVAEISAEKSNQDNE